ncbi:MAG: hypothetical protein Q4D54_08965 [Eubacteriales bacterium]|nr:hypothetical protein [Lachnospiraceae bacterium]MDO5127862.1 hypothetical protein [Eubacteriales bacterium]
MYIGGMSNNYIIPVSNISKVTPVNTDNTIDSSTKVQPTECQTCKERKYVDGSNEADVSFKTPGHIAPEQSFAKVSAHEREHVANAMAKASKPGAKLVSSRVTLQMGVCPECGRTYVAGGVTNTQIRYTESNPYEKNRKQLEGSILAGANIDASA